MKSDTGLESVIFEKGSALGGHILLGGCSLELVSRGPSVTLISTDRLPLAMISEWRHNPHTRFISAIQRTDFGLELNLQHRYCRQQLNGSGDMDIFGILSLLVNSGALGIILFLAILFGLGGGF